MEWQMIIVNVLTTIITTIILHLLSMLFFVNSFKQHRSLNLKIKKFKRSFVDPNNHNKNDSMNIKRIGEQQKELKDMLDSIDEVIDDNRIFAFLFDYKKLRRCMVLLFEYNRNPIMLPNSKIFDNNYRMDLNIAFKSLNNIMKFPKRFLLLLLFLLIIILVILQIIF